MARRQAAVRQRTPPSCFGRTATLVGTADDDVLRGTPDRDVIVGRGGRDIIRGFAGNDYICNGSQVRRSIQGLFYGGAGADHLRGRAYMSGQEGNDLMTSMFGTAYGGPGDDQFTGGRRLNTAPGPGRDRVHIHGSGSLIYSDASGPVTVNLTRGYALGEGRDTIRGTITHLHGSQYADVLRGSRRAEELNGEAGHDLLLGMAGPDSLVGSGGRDVARGGTGHDTCYGSTEERHSCPLDKDGD